MNKVRVVQTFLSTECDRWGSPYQDWDVFCDACTGIHVGTSSWRSAMEAAWGHVAMGCGR